MKYQGAWDIDSLLKSYIMYIYDTQTKSIRWRFRLVNYIKKIFIFVTQE
jgi:hypothetical protein